MEKRNKLTILPGNDTLILVINEYKISLDNIVNLLNALKNEAKQKSCADSLNPGQYFMVKDFENSDIEKAYHLGYNDGGIETSRALLENYLY